MLESGESTFLAGKLSMRAIPAEVTALIEPFMHRRRFATGQFLMQQGDTAKSIMVLDEGVVEIFTTDESGTRQHINKGSRGDVLGEMALLSGEPRSASVLALSDVKALVLPAERFHELAHDHPALSVVLTKLVADRLAGSGPDVLHGKTFHDYRIVRRLGRGGMSIVYEAIDPNGQHVALKMMSHSLVYDDFGREQFEREVRAIESLNHENIVRVFGRFAAFHSFFMIMEHCRGANLSEVIKYNGPLPEEEIRKIVGQLAAAVLAAHDSGLVHRDIKPANIMLIPEGTVKLMDFGLAAPVIDESLSQYAKHVVGTPRYMAPEQLDGKPAGFPADYFSFGAVVYELLTGKPLFAERKLSQLRKRHAQWNFPDYDVLRPTKNEWSRQLLAECLIRDPQKRRPDLSAIAKWAAPVDAGMLPGGNADTGKAGWEDETIME
ncbi:Serine/threonine-protein kinase StkP [Symmachiella dynata]|uniref:protein kinase domain-containing protein n=1 Tax=Symmachiella dynata TaxID=2527995 RepID=UPI0011899069|nr:protein kinase [Symmachiella dynata]QDT46054.1 Serine/threonine-protein kinase StkP [Symmachiella dynata]